MGSKRLILKITYSSIIAALYAIVTIVTIPISFGPIQFRVAEALNILPLFFPESIIGLTIGCLISNLFSPSNILLDATLGTGATLLSAVLCYLIGKVIKKEPLRVILGIIPAIVINALVVPFTFLAYSSLKELYLIEALSVFLGQTGVLIILGIPLYYALKSINQKFHIF